MQGKRVVLVLDDAHLFKAAAWEEVERMASYRLEKRGAIEINRTTCRRRGIC